ncbi:ComF family protein [Pseudonocardia eucalypti]|uniref:ComF family protein n=1 Tax=Pseudonocardia eucalypti TaxID=648755 RepID=A0ABP9PY19_9PSEU|nr:putative amidophosphoribosyltransferase [Pseudonocardia eucalypti]
MAAPRALWRGLVELVLPLCCAGCGRHGAAWCPDCAAGVGRPRFVGGLPALPPVVAAGRYAGPLRAALLGYKERGRRELAGPLAGQLHAALRGCPLPVAERCWLVPAPSRRAAVRARGHDHVRTLAERLAELLAANVAVGVGCALRMRGGGRDSVGLSPAARAANLLGRVGVDRSRLPPPGAEVLVIDDVVTTGVTLRHCVAALSEAGVPVRGALVLCDATGAS